jgi:hypothetical protein
MELNVLEDAPPVGGRTAAEVALWRWIVANRGQAAVLEDRVGYMEAHLVQVEHPVGSNPLECVPMQRAMGGLCAAEVKVAGRQLPSDHCRISRPGVRISSSPP